LSVCHIIFLFFYFFNDALETQNGSSIAQPYDTPILEPLFTYSMQNTVFNEAMGTDDMVKFKQIFNFLLLLLLLLLLKNKQLLKYMEC